MRQGLNSNIKHKDQIFHIQTEDSGSKYGHITSHLFQEGSILATVKTEYMDLLAEKEGEDFEEALLKLMRKSHRKMVAKLTAGGFDKKLDATTAEENTVEVAKESDEATDAKEDFSNIDDEEFKIDIDDAIDKEIENISTRERKSSKDIVLKDEELKELQDLKKHYGFEVIAIEEEENHFTEEAEVAPEPDSAKANEENLPSVDHVYNTIKESLNSTEGDISVKQALLKLIN